MHHLTEQARRHPASRANTKEVSLVFLLITAFFTALLGGAGCRRAPSKTRPGGDTARGRAEAIPQRAAPPLPPALPLPVDEGAFRPEHRGGTLRIHLDNEPPYLNPLLDLDAGTMALLRGPVYETLLRCPADGRTGTYRPGLAESWDVSADGLRVLLRLKRQIRWHDGRLFNVLDVQATLEPLLRASGSGAVALRAALADVQTVEIASDHQVRLNLKRPSDFVLRALCDLPILPEHLLRGSRAEAQSLLRQPVGTGPFRVAAWERGKRIRLQRVSAEGEGPALDEVSFEIDPDGMRALLKTKRGELDVLPHVLDVHYPEQVEPVTLHESLSLTRLTPLRSVFLVVNHRHAPLDEVEFRRALAMLWDRERFAREVHKGLMHPIGSPLFGQAVEPVFDPKRAAARLDELGLRDTDADGVRDRGGKPVRLQLLVPSGGRTFSGEARAFAIEARRAGILVDPITVEPSQVMGRLKSGDFDLAPMLWVSLPDEDPELLYGSNGAFNWGGYRSASADALLEEARLAQGAAARVPLLETLGHLLAAETPVIWLYRQDLPALVSRRVHGLAARGEELDFLRAWLDP